jgi:putative CocE/NonD family hydrolase
MRFLDTSRIRTRFDERVIAADGTELSLDLYLPPEPGSYPVLLNRTAADNNRVGRASISPPPAERCKALAAQGYIVASADVRGRGDSGGRFVPFIHEAEDGAATVAWLRTMAECNGRIGVFGSGYGAFCAWAAAVADGHVDAIASISPFGAIGEGQVHRGGAVRLDWLFWMHLVAGRTVQPPSVPPWPRIHRHVPLATMDDALGREDIWWGQWLEHLDRHDPYWASLDLAERIAATRIPGLHVTGWWDGQVGAARYYYEAACRCGERQTLIIGPWDTAAVRRPCRSVGGFDFGPRSVIDLDETLVGFFDVYLRHCGDPVHTQSRMFITGRNEWVSCDTSPFDGKEIFDLYLSSASGANTRRGDGRLSGVQPKDHAVDTVVHNPDVPIDFQPQFVSFAATASTAGCSLEQSHITGRDEALVFTSAPLQQPITVLGRPKVVLSVRTNAADADLCVLLSDCFPLGTRDFHLAHGAIRLQMLPGFQPGQLVTVELTLDAVAHRFYPGHQIRLTLTPSLFPLYARNMQSRGYATAIVPAVAEIELHHGPSMGTLLRLPLAPSIQEDD